jgi:hypothetical protein
VSWYVDSTPENALEFEQAQLTLPARRRALQVRSIARVAAQGLEEDIIALHEDGVSFSFGNEKIHREVVFVVPLDGAVLYFIARGTNRFRRAGIVLRDTAIATLARWASRESVEFSSRDLEVG